MRSDRRTHSGGGRHGEHLAPSNIDGVTVAAKATSYPAAATIADICTDAGYQQGVADALGG